MNNNDLAFYIANVSDPGDIFAEPAADAGMDERRSLVIAVDEYRRNLRGLTKHPINRISREQLDLLRNAVDQEYDPTDGDNERAAAHTNALLALDILANFIFGPNAIINIEDFRLCPNCGEPRHEHVTNGTGCEEFVAGVTTDGMPAYSGADDIPQDCRP